MQVTGPVSFSVFVEWVFAWVRTQYRQNLISEVLIQSSEAFYDCIS